MTRGESEVWEIESYLVNTFVRASGRRAGNIFDHFMYPLEELMIEPSGMGSSELEDTKLCECRKRKSFAT